jgi:DNA-binding XRE family transcriptional regulator
MPDLRALRKQLGLTQAELAGALGVTRETISNHERGVAPVPRERMLAVLCLCWWAIMREVTLPPTEPCS